VVKFDPKIGKQFKAKSSILSYTQYFVESLINEAEIDNKIVVIHAAMGCGTGLNYFHKRFPDRCFDVGITEQHVVTFAVGLAAKGLKPFCAIYSSSCSKFIFKLITSINKILIVVIYCVSS
ncbi:hypothetical protein V8G54_036080, partial [Vigna mungo]